jgi:hypothetical protein
MQEFKRETRFTSKCPPKEIVRKIEEVVDPLFHFGNTIR